MAGNVLEAIRAKITDTLKPVPAEMAGMSFTSLEKLFSERRYEGYMVSIKCRWGGGAMIPIGSDNIAFHAPEIREHLGHGDDVILTTFKDEPVVFQGQLITINPKVHQKFRLTP